MNNLIRNIKSQLTPSNKCLNDLNDRINGIEPVTVKRAGWKGIALPLTTAVAAVFIISVAAGSSGKKDSDTILPSATVETNEEVSANEYPTNVPKTDPTTDEGIFDLNHGGYWSNEKHSPVDPPNEKTKLDLLKKNIEVDYAKYIFHSTDDTFSTYYHVSTIPEFIGMGKVKYGDKIYELLIGVRGVEGNKIYISFGDGDFYEFVNEDIPFSIERYYISLDMTEDGKSYIRNYYLNLDSGDYSKEDIYREFNDKYYLNDEIYQALISKMKEENYSIVMRDGTGMSYDDCYYYEFVEECERSEFNDDDLAGYGTMQFVSVQEVLPQCFFDFAVIANSPDENGDIKILFPGDRVLKLSRLSYNPT